MAVVVDVVFEVEFEELVLGVLLLDAPDVAGGDDTFVTVVTVFVVEGGDEGIGSVEGFSGDREGGGVIGTGGIYTEEIAPGYIRAETGRQSVVTLQLEQSKLMT